MVLTPVLSFAMATIDPNTQRLLDILMSPQGGSEESAQEVARLLAAGADAKNLGPVATLKITPLHMAVGKGSTKIVKLLLPYYKDNINPRDIIGRTPLWDAVDNRALPGQEELIKLLLNAGADPRIPTYNGVLPIYIATDRARNDAREKTNTKIAQVLKDYSDILPESILNPTPETLKKAINIGAISLVKQLLSQLSLTVDQLSSFGQDAQARFVKTGDPVYKEIALLFLERLKKIHSLMGTTQEGRRSPVEIATSIINSPVPQNK